MDAKDRLQELGSSRVASGARGRGAVSARARCRHKVWETTVLLGILMSGTAVLLNLLIEQSIQLHVISALIFATIPAAAALAVSAILLAMLWLLGTTYDLLRMFVLPSLLWCVCFGVPVILDASSRLNRYLAATFGWTAERLGQFARGVASGIRQILRGAGTRARHGLAWMSREMALEALWIKQGVCRVLGIGALLACWPIRASASLVLRLTDRYVSMEGPALAVRDGDYTATERKTLSARSPEAQAHFLGELAQSGRRDPPESGLDKLICAERQETRRRDGEQYLPYGCRRSMRRDPPRPSASCGS